jgi:ankyrin repeat protein
MSEDKNVNNDDGIDINEILNACNGVGGIEEDKKVFLKYFNPKKSLLDINKPLQGQGKWNALAFAVFFGKAEHALTLLKLGANPSVDLGADNNVLHMAATDGKEFLCEYFLKKGINIDSVCKRGMTPLLKACEAGHLNVVKVLLPHNPKITQADNDGKTCIDYCKESKSFDIIRYINNYHLNQILPHKKGDEIPQKKVSKI